MHIIVKEFVETNSRLSTLLEKYYDKDQYLETVFLKIGQVLNNENIDKQTFLDLDNAIIKGHSDQNLYLLFISFVIPFLCYRTKLEQAKVLLSLGESISQEGIHPVLKSYYTLSKGILEISDRKTDEGNKLLKEAITLIDKKSPRYNTILMGMASMISLEGKLNELTPEELTLLDAAENENFAIVSVNLKVFNCIFIGKIKEGQVLIEEYKKLLKGKLTKLIQNLIDHLKIMSGDFDEKNYDRIFFKNIVNALSALSSGKFEEALRFSALLTNEKDIFENRFIFRINLTLHIELSLKNIGMAKLLFQEMAQNRSPHYLDDFYLARIQLLEMDRDGAYTTFRRLIENVKKYDAMNRLIFEMQFAKEMKSSDVLWLMSGLDENNNKNLVVLKKLEAPIYNNSENGIRLLVGDSPAITQVRDLVKKFAKLKEPVLITGETGTGKELVSRAIHDEGPYPKEPFLAINCGALTESLLQSELFGYVAGAFTGAQKERKGIFEAAGKGTVFLDEFGDISSKLQASLLRVLESNEIRLIGGTATRQIECKIVIATNIDLHQVVKEKKFREDLYFRLTRFDIKLPPLRERREDIPKIIDYFLADKNNLSSKQKIISKELLEALTAYHWPGNIRELKNEIERMKILHAEKKIINWEDFDFSRLQGAITNRNQVNENGDLNKVVPKVNKKIRDVNDADILKIVQRGSKADQRHEFLKELFKKYKKLTRSQIIDIAMISPLTATKDLKILCKSGYIEKCMPTKSVRSHYFILVE